MKILISFALLLLFCSGCKREADDKFRETLELLAVYDDGGRVQVAVLFDHRLTGAGIGGAGYVIITARKFGVPPRRIQTMECASYTDKRFRESIQDVGELKFRSSNDEIVIGRAGSSLRWVVDRNTLDISAKY